MGRGLRIGRLFGIQLRLDPSLIIIFLLIVFSLALGVFPAWHPEWPPALHWGVAAAASALFLASILAHELAHSLVAKAQKIPVESITLFLFGGISNIEREPRSPGAEAVMAAVGPLTSIALGVLFLTLAALTGSFQDGPGVTPFQLLQDMGPFTTLMAWLGPINILVGLFNLLPGFPLDGGRILRAILWAITGDNHRATVWATMAGQGLGWAFVVMGVSMAFGVWIPVFGTGLVPGLWIAFIGWFLSRAAVASRRQRVVQDILEDVPVRQVMTRDLRSVSVGLDLQRLVEDHVLRSDQRAFPVVDEVGRLLGLVTLEDVKTVPRDRWREVSVEEVMTGLDRLAMARPDEETNEAFRTMMKRDIAQLPVVEEGMLQGVLRRQDILRWLDLADRGRAPPGS